MSPSSQVETISVEATGAALVDVQKTDVSRPITPSEVQNLPLNGRDFVNLAILAPGARQDPPYDPTKARIGFFATNGSRDLSGYVTLNPIVHQNTTNHLPCIIIPRTP